MPRFFIERPIFAWVIAIVIMLGGVFAIETLRLNSIRRSLRQAFRSGPIIRALRPRCLRIASPRLSNRV